MLSLFYDTSLKNLIFLTTNVLSAKGFRAITTSLLCLPLWWICKVSTWLSWITFSRISFHIYFSLSWAKRETPGGVGWWKENRSHFVTHLFSFICICSCSTFPGTSFSLSVSWTRCVCWTSPLRTLASAGHPQHQGQRQQLLTWISVYPHWVQAHIGGFQLVFPLQLYNNLLLFWLSALCTLKSSIRHEDNSFTETCWPASTKV